MIEAYIASDKGRGGGGGGGGRGVCKLISYFSSKNMLWYSLAAPRRGASYDYPQYVFVEK